MYYVHNALVHKETKLRLLPCSLCRELKRVATRKVTWRCYEPLTVGQRITDVRSTGTGRFEDRFFRFLRSKYSTPQRFFLSAVYTSRHMKTFICGKEKASVKQIAKVYVSF